MAEYRNGSAASRFRIDVAKWVLFVALQASAAFFYVADVGTELFRDGPVAHTMLESLATIALLFGVVAGSLEIRKLVQKEADASETLRRATSAFSDMVDERFRQWSLTAAEREVALLLLKGFEVGEIAALRGTAEGTVRAQLSRIYEKSGQPNRGSLVSSFLDTLVDTPLSVSLPASSRRSAEAAE